MELAAAADRLDGGDDVADTPRARHHQHGPILGGEPEVAADGVAVVLGVAEALAHERPARAGVLAAAGFGRRRRDLTHREMAVDATVDPERVDGEVGEVGDHRDPELLLAPHTAEDERRQRIHRHDRVGPEVLDRTLERAAGQPGVEHHRRGTQDRRHLVAQLVAPRRHAQLPLVVPAQQRPDVERDRVEEVDDLDPVPRRLETPAQLVGRAVVAGAHGRGDDEDAPAHETRDYRPRGMAAVLLALGAALAYAAASVLQQREAEADTGGEGGGAVGGGIRLVVRLARKPIWLAGLGADALGYGLQAAALGVGELLVVQPVLTSGILFALPVSAWWSGRRLGRTDFAWACTLAVGLTVFLLLAGTDGGLDRASTEAWLVCGAIAGAGARRRVWSRVPDRSAPGARSSSRSPPARSSGSPPRSRSRASCSSTTTGSARSATGSRTRSSCSVPSASS